MEKIPLVTSIVSIIFAYYSISPKRLIDLKIFAIWCCLLILISAHSLSLYQLLTSAEPISLTRILTLNFAAIGMLVLLGAGVFLKIHLRPELERQSSGQ